VGNPGLSPTYDIVIVGAGIVGAACAMECARSGLKVLVLDRGPVGGGSTAACMGHIVTMDDSPAQFALTTYSRQRWLDLAAGFPDEVEYNPCGTLWVAADQEEMGEVERKAHFYRQNNVRCLKLGARDLISEEPNLRSGLVGGLRVVDDAVVYPPCAAWYFLYTAKRYQAEIRTGVEVRQLSPDGVARLADGSQISAAVLLNAAGCWSSDLTPGLPVRKRKGHLVVTDRYPHFARHQIVELGYLKSAHGVSKDSVAFNVQPRKTGQMLIGSSRQFDSEQSDVEFPMLTRMLSRACEYMPGLRDLSSVRCWAGFRPATPDKLPLIGPDPVQDRIWFATGHEGLGITTALGTAKLVADMITKQTTDIPAEPYAPARFAKS
jgi:glycine/D-amino acid oxidase-like deaminating enzyme